MIRATVVAVTLALTVSTPLGITASDDSATLLTVVKKKTTVVDPHTYARRASRSSSEYRCLRLLWTKESNWRHTAANPSSSAYGIAQLLGETSRDPKVQIDNGLRYIAHRYGTPCAAWAHWQHHHWY